MKNKIVLLLFIAGLYSACSYNPFTQGEILYGNFCASCHGEQGEGFRDLYPPVANSDYFQQHQLETACIIRYGMEKEIVVNGKTFEQPMSALTQLNPVEICNIINFISHNWNPDLEPVTIDQVKEQLDQCKERATIIY